MNFETLLLQTEQHICTVTINRPDKLNALNNLVLDELEKAFNHIHQTDEIKGVIITGAGEKAFVAGADIKELSSLNGASGTKASEKGQRIFSLIEQSSKPVIAVVNGYALGGGTELALAAHIRIASSNAVFGLPEVSLGLIPGYGGTQRLIRLVGKGKAMELILTGRMVKAEEALSLGIANSTQPTPAEAIIAAREMLGVMFKHGPVAIASAIKAVNASEVNSEIGYNKEAEVFGSLCETSDFKEGTGAFLEKRKPVFTGN
jgi:enoyl-CoA hydratase